MGIGRDRHIDNAMWLYQEGKIDRQYIFDHFGHPAQEELLARIKAYEEAVTEKVDDIAHARSIHYPGGLECTKPTVRSVMDEAIKYDHGKPAFDLIPSKALEEVAKVYGYGANKYSRRNWEKGMNWCRIFGAIMRHAWAWMRGETLDPETGLHHMAHAAFGCLALIEYHHTGAGKDDRNEAEEVLQAHEVKQAFPEGDNK